MKKEISFSHDGLFQIGEVVKCCGVDRQTILFYEKMGLIEPSAKKRVLRLSVLLCGSRNPVS